MKIENSAITIVRKNPNPPDEVYHAQFPREDSARVGNRWVVGWSNAVQKWFKQMGWLVYHTKNSSRSQEGFPDLVLVLPGVATVYAEMKTERGELTDDQVKWLLALAWNNEQVYVWRPSDTNEIQQIIQDCHVLSLQYGRQLTENVVGGKV